MLNLTSNESNSWLGNEWLLFISILQVEWSWGRQNRIISEHSKAKTEFWAIWGVQDTPPNSVLSFQCFQYVNFAPLWKTVTEDRQHSVPVLLGGENILNSESYTLSYLWQVCPCCPSNTEGFKETTCEKPRFWKEAQWLGSIPSGCRNGRAQKGLLWVVSKGEMVTTCYGLCPSASLMGDKFLMSTFRSSCTLLVVMM